METKLYTAYIESPHMNTRFLKHISFPVSLNKSPTIFLGLLIFDTETTPNWKLSPCWFWLYHLFARGVSGSVHQNQSYTCILKNELCFVCVPLEPYMRQFVSLQVKTNWVILTRKRLLEVFGDVMMDLAARQRYFLRLDRNYITSC